MHIGQYSVNMSDRPQACSECSLALAAQPLTMYTNDDEIDD